MTQEAPALYLDVCVLCRPFDDQTQTRIRRETQGYYRVLQAVQDGRYVLLRSAAHQAEVAAIGNPLERNEVQAILVQQGIPCAINGMEPLRRRAEALVGLGMGVADAAHVAFAEASAAFFISCDDRLLKQCARLGVAIPALTPTTFCEQEQLSP